MDQSTLLGYMSLTCNAAYSGPPTGEAQGIARARLPAQRGKRPSHSMATRLSAGFPSRIGIVHVMRNEMRIAWGIQLCVLLLIL